jgi:hypothetical protein
LNTTMQNSYEKWGIHRKISCHEDLELRVSATHAAAPTPASQLEYSCFTERMHPQVYLLGRKGKIPLTYLHLGYHNHVLNVYFSRLEGVYIYMYIYIVYALAIAC